MEFRTHTGFVHLVTVATMGAKHLRPIIMCMASNPVIYHVKMVAPVVKTDHEAGVARVDHKVHHSTKRGERGCKQ